MKPFTYERAETVAHTAAASSRPGARLIAGGTNLLDLMKLEIETPTHLVDVSRLPLTSIEDGADGGLRIGSQVPNGDLAADARVRRRYPLLAQALLVGASAQLRNKATTGGSRPAAPSAGHRRSGVDGGARPWPQRFQAAAGTPHGRRRAGRGSRAGEGMTMADPIARNRQGIIGRPVDRVDGRLKVTGTAPHAHEVREGGRALHGFIVEATIAKGRVAAIDTRAAERAPGVRLVYTYLNAPRQAARGAPPGRSKPGPA